MSQALPEFSRFVPLSRLGFESFHLHIEATAAEREQLALRFDLLSLDRLTAAVTLSRRSRQTIRLDAVVEAAFAQECVVSLEPVTGILTEPFSLIYGPPAEQPGEIELDAEETAFEPLVGDAIDIGEAVAQELSLMLPVAPRDPEAVIEAEIPQAPMEGPFARLAGLHKAAKD